MTKADLRPGAWPGFQKLPAPRPRAESISPTRLRIEEALPQKGEPLLLNFDDAIARQAGARIEFHRNRGEKTPTRKNSPLEMGKKGINQRPKPLRSCRRLHRGLKHFTVKNLGGGFNRRQFQFFLGFEVSVQAAFAHPDFGGQVADRQAVQPLRCRQFCGGEQNGGATGLAFRRAGSRQLPNWFLMTNWCS